MFPTVSIIGKPNSGKSTLFNRIAGKKSSITYGDPGTTRDRVFELVPIDQRDVLFVDTAGIDDNSAQDLEDDMRRQSLIAVKESDLVIFAVDTTTPLTTADFYVAEQLRASQKPVILVGTKSDNAKSNDYFYDLFGLGFGDPIQVSSIHNEGIEELFDLVKKQLKSLKLMSKKNKDEGKRISLSFVGRPNVGKSSLMNAILGREQVVVSDIPGTTRDSISTFFEFSGSGFVLTDTAGIRRSGRRESHIEKFSVLRSLRSIDESDICVLVADSFEGLSKQDMRVSQFILEAKKGLIIVLNKSDLVNPSEKNRLLAILQDRMDYAHFSPVVFTSATRGTHVTNILELAIKIYAERYKRIETRELNYFLEKIIGAHPPKSGLKFKYIEQVDVNPPTFEVFLNDPDEVHFSYRRYIENSMREQFGYEGTALAIYYKQQNVVQRRQGNTR